MQEGTIMEQWIYNKMKKSKTWRRLFVKLSDYNNLVLAFSFITIIIAICLYNFTSIISAFKDVLDFSFLFVLILMALLNALAKVVANYFQHKTEDFNEAFC